MESQWILSTVATWIISNDSVLGVVDFLNTWGLIAIGAGLILGLFSKVASYGGVVLLMLYYLINPPLTGLEYSMPSEGNYLIINKTLIEAVTLFVLSIFPTSHLVGLDLFLGRMKKRMYQREESKNAR
jgi:thiosulfate dehydrogenase [quinone] large subunit